MEIILSYKILLFIFKFDRIFHGKMLNLSEVYKY